MASELVVAYNPMPAAERVAHYQGVLRSRLIWLGVGVVVLLGIWFWQRQVLTTVQTVLLFVLGLSFSGVWAIIAAVLYGKAKRQLAEVNRIEGSAMRIDGQGITVSDRLIAWPQVGKISTARGALGAGPVLTISDLSGSSQTVPLAHLDALPGTIDNAIRAFSGGRHWLDTSGLGN